MATAKKKSHAETERAYSNQSRKNKPTTELAGKGKYSDGDFNAGAENTAAHRDEEGRNANAKQNETRDEDGRLGENARTAGVEGKYQNADDVNATPSRAGKDSDKDGLTGHARDI